MIEVSVRQFISIKRLFVIDTFTWFRLWIIYLSIIIIRERDAYLVIRDFVISKECVIVVDQIVGLTDVLREIVLTVVRRRENAEPHCTRDVDLAVDNRCIHPSQGHENVALHFEVALVNDEPLERWGIEHEKGVGWGVAESRLLEAQTLYPKMWVQYHEFHLVWVQGKTRQETLLVKRQEVIRFRYFWT